MKIFGVLFVLGLMDACLGRTMKPATIKKRFREAKYAFKFRVVSKPTGECFPGPSAVTTPETTSTTTTTSTTAPTTKTASTADATQGTTTISTTQTTNPPTYGTSTGPSTNAVKETLTDHLATVQMQTTTTSTTTSTTTTTTSTTTSTSPSETDKMPSTSVTSNLPESITNAPVVSTGQNSVQNSLATRENPSSQLASTNPTISETAEKMGKKKILNETVFFTKQPKTLPLDNKNSSVNTSEGMGAGRKKRSCDMMVYHQDIIIGRKHIYKACDEINEMKRVDGMNKKYLKSTIRLQLDFSGLKPNRNYFFMGRAVPGQDSSDYVFMADELTVVNWKSGAWKLKKYLRSNGGQCN